MNIAANQKRIIIVSIVVLVVILVVAAGKWYVLPSFTTPVLPVSAARRSHCNMVRQSLKVYYEGLKGKVPENLSSDFVDFLTSNSMDKRFSKQVPAAGYTSEYDLGFFLLLPNKLESDNPVLIAYTSPFPENTGKLYRGALFLRGREITMLSLYDGTVRAIVGREDFDNRIPDLYVWQRRPEYLREKLPEGK